MIKILVALIKNYLNDPNNAQNNKIKKVYIKVLD